jgi:AcrR family transcriptional regulator
MNPRSTKEAPRLRERLKEVARGAILQAAAEEFAQEGLHVARMERIAARAGVAVGTLYNHFEDKDALLQALIEDRRDELVRRMDEALAAERKGNFRQQLEAFVRVLMEHFEAHRPFLAVLVQAEHVKSANLLTVVGGPSPTMLEVYRRAEKVVQVGLKEKALRTEDADLFPALLVGTLRSVLIREVLYASEERGVSERIRAIVSYFLHGAGAR